MRRSPVLALVVLLGGTFTGCRCDRDQDRAPAPAAAPRPAAPFTLAPFVERARVPAIAYGIVTRDKPVAFDAAGFADSAKKVDATTETIFEAASIAKTVIGVSVMQLVEQKKLDLDADVSTYVGFPVKHPTLAGAKGTITLRHVLSHRGSIVDHVDQLEDAREKATLGDFLKGYLAQENAYASTAPGARVVYSNVGAALAAYAVEHVSGESFDDYTAKHVFAPLKMTSTGWTAKHPSFVVAVPHQLDKGAFTALPQASHAIYPAVDLRSTASDLGRFARAVLRDGELDGARILEVKSVETMLAPADDAKEEALGWQLRKIAGRRVAGHEGEDAGATTGMYLDRAAGFAAIVLANGDAFTSGDDARTKAIQDLFASLFDLLQSSHAN